MRVKVYLVVDPCSSKMRAKMKDARQNFKQILGKVEIMKEVELFMQIPASLTLIQKVAEHQGVCRELYTSHLCFLKLINTGIT